ncbi:MAG: hypothetical protein JO369_01540 [Paucibacter sp.]|nr:hypothetical protein [Roseateles sp.]
MIWRRHEALLKQRQLELRLRSMELRVELEKDFGALRRPWRWASVLASLAGTAALGWSLRRPGLASRGLVVTQLVLRLLRGARRLFGRDAPK